MREQISDLLNKIQLAHKYFLRNTPHEGPIEETELGIEYLRLDLDHLYESIHDSSSRLKVIEIGNAEYAGQNYPIFKITKKDVAPNAPHLMAWSAVHGNEQAAFMALPFVLNDLVTNHPAYDGVNVTLLAPLNPVGVVHRSRYNGQGLDINRDFVRFRTKEASLIRDVLAADPPDFVVSLHEGPQNGTFLCTNQFVRPQIYASVLRNLYEQGIELADKDFVGRKLPIPGLQKVDGLVTAYGEFSKHMLGLQTSGHYLRERGIPLITVESPWRNPNADQRIRAHVQVMRTVASLNQRS